MKKKRPAAAALKSVRTLKRASATPYSCIGAFLSSVHDVSARAAKVVLYWNDLQGSQRSETRQVCKYQK